MTIEGKNRSPHQTFGFGTWEPEPGDDDLRERTVQVRPAFNEAVAGRVPVTPTELREAPDLAGLPWRRDGHQAWTTAALRAEVLTYLRAFFRDRPDQGLVGWRILELRQRFGTVGYDPDHQTLVFTIKKRRARGGLGEAEVAVAFAEGSRAGIGLASLLDALTAALDAALSTIV